MKQNRNQIANILNQHKELFKKNYNVEDLGVFGSFARGDNAQTSDIDILVRFSQPLGFFKFIELENYLKKLLGRKVDLVTEKALKPAIKNDVLREVMYV
jgi:uncharacterized protein